MVEVSPTKSKSSFHLFKDFDQLSDRKLLSHEADADCSRESMSY